MPKESASVNRNPCRRRLSELSYRSVLSTPSADLLTDIVIVARNQAASLAAVLAQIPARSCRSVVVVDNGSSDGTAAVARDAGAVLIRENHPGYGAGCLRAQAHLEALPRPPDAVVYLGADGGDDPHQIERLLAPMREDNAELCLGVRTADGRPRTRAHLTRGLITAIYRHHFADVDRFRAIRFPALVALSLTDRGNAFPVEMQIKAVKLGLHIAEVPISHHTAHGRTPSPQTLPASDPSRRHKRPHATKRLADAVGTGGKSLFHILRHAITR